MTCQHLRAGNLDPKRIPNYVTGVKKASKFVTQSGRGSRPI